MTMRTRAFIGIAALLVLLLAASFILIGCKSAPPTAGGEQNAPDFEGKGATSEPATDMDRGVDEIAGIQQDLNSNELDTLDSDLSNVTW